MQLIVKQVHKLLIKTGKTIATAESCTGGLLSKLLTDSAGSSQYFVLGLVAYVNKAKRTALKIPAKLIRNKGAVCKETAQAMAEAIRKIAKSDFGIGVTGIAGPTGAAVHRPIGTVFIAIDSKNNKISKRFCFSGGRDAVRRKAALKSLGLLKSCLLSHQ